MMHVIKFIDHFFLLHNRILVAIVLFIFTNLRFLCIVSFLLLFLRESVFWGKRNGIVILHLLIALRILLGKRIVKTISIDFVLEDIT